MKKIIYILLILLFPVFSLAATYYVDGTSSGCSGTPDTDYDIATRACGSGSDSVYSTVQLAADDVSSAGDIVYIRTGTYGEQVNWDTNSGSDPNYITFEACHDGTDGDCSDADSYESVILSDGSSYAAFSIADGVSWIKFVGLIFDGEDTTNHTVNIRGVNNIYFDSCEFRDCATYGNIYVANQNGNNTTSITIINSKIYDGGGEGFYSSNEHSVTHYVDGVLVQDTEIYGNAEAVQVARGGGYATAPANVIIRGCEIYNNGASAWALFDVEPDGGGFIFEDNIVRDNGTGIMVAGIDLKGGGSPAPIIRNNLFYDNAGSTANDAAIRLSGADNAQIYYNSILNHGTGANGQGVYGTNGPSGNLVKNNIFHSVNQNAITGTGITEDYNVCYNNGTDCSNTNDQTGDPKFISVVDGSENLRLQSGSSAIENGTDVSISDDIEGTTRVGYDIGAYEYGGALLETMTGMGIE